MMKPWIKDFGEDGLEAVRQKVSGYIKDHPDAIALIACTDSYQGVKAAEGETVLPDNMLEIRVFTGKSELWAHRSTTAHPFSWRIADDDILAENVKKEGNGYFADPEHYRIPCVQKLDIDTRYKELRTTGGKYYHLPITNENTVCLIRYADYDERGNAHAVDFRVAGFDRNPDFEEGGK